MGNNLVSCLRRNDIQFITLAYFLCFVPFMVKYKPFTIGSW
jgi:hypothetical protein